MSQKTVPTERLISEGTARLIARATTSRSLDSAALTERVVGRLQPPHLRWGELREIEFTVRELPVP